MTSDEPERAFDFRKVFEAAPDAMLLATDDRRYVDANPAACHLLQRSIDELMRMRVEDVTAAGVDVAAAWQDFLDRGEMRGEYRLARPDGSLIDVEFHATAGVMPGVHLSILRDVSDRKHAERERDRAHAELRDARDQARQIALTLQRSMLPATVEIAGLDVATRYYPASDVLAVGGDWYDLIRLDERRIAVAVGDVMGHGIAAAGAMGQLRSALAAAFHAEFRPSHALAILDAYARSLRNPLIATVFAGVLDLEECALTYASAGHLPQLLVADEVELLGGATAPPLTAAPEPGQHPQATVHVPRGAVLVLFTDGLIEHRKRDIDEGLGKLAAATLALRGRDCNTIADALLDELRGVTGEQDDDVVLVVLKP